MKKVLGWVKSNLLIVIVLVVAVVAIPVQIYFSSSWNQKIREEVSSDASQAMSRLNGLSVNYEIDGMLTSDGQAWTSDSVAPSAALNKRMETVLSRLSEESEGVRDLAINHNSAGKALLVDGASPDEKLFPRPSNESARVRLMTELTRERPEAYAALLEEARAGMPPDPDELLRTLEARRTREVQNRVQGRVDQTLSPEEQEEIRELLSSVRMDFYQQRAESISFYADPSVFVNVTPPGESLPSLETAWEWQMEYWIAEDLVAAIDKANTDGRGLAMSAPRAPVKRVLSIDVLPWSAGGSSGGGSARFGRGDMDDSMPMPTDPNAVIEPTFATAHTGRAGFPGAPNALYDVRYARITVIVDMNRVPDLLDAISTTNFMTVTDLDFEAIDPMPALLDGFVYGGDAVARAELRVETIWLRSWMTRWMPAEVRTRLGVPDDPEPEPGADGAADGTGDEF